MLYCKVLVYSTYAAVISKAKCDHGNVQTLEIVCSANWKHITVKCWPSRTLLFWLFTSQYKQTLKVHSMRTLTNRKPANHHQQLLWQYPYLHHSPLPLSTICLLITSRIAHSQEEHLCEDAVCRLQLTNQPFRLDIKLGDLDLNPLLCTRIFSFSSQWSEGFLLQCSP